MRRLVHTISLFLAATAIAPLSQIAKAEKPNIVLVVVDTLRADRLPIYGHERNTAPFLTKLARRSVVFERAHSTSSWTAPAVTSILTSLYPFQHGVQLASASKDGTSFEIRTIPATVRTLPETLAAAGYRTYAVTDNQNVGERGGFMRGFQRFRNMHYESAAAVNEVVSQWHKDIVGDAPYFLYIHYMDPHYPYHERAPWYAELAASAEGTESGGAPRALARYDSEIRYVDAHIEKLFELFGWKNDTVLIVTSDHGEEFEEHGGRQHGRTLYAEVLDVPLLLHYPARWPQGKRIGQRVSVVDIAPTVLALAGPLHDPQYVGHNLIPAIDGEGNDDIAGRQIHADLLTEIGSGKKQAQLHINAVIDGSMKLLDSAEQPNQLYDLAADPGERNNLAAAHPESAATLSAVIASFIAQTRKFEPGRARVELSQEQREKMKMLGYK